MKASLHIPADAAYFEGHFHDRPILPGVTQLKLIVDLLARELEQPPHVRQIVFTRLRQIVLPGDHLEVTARTLGDARLRVDVTRGGAVITNSELELGAPLLAAAPAPTPCAQTSPGAKAIGIDQLLPQRPPMQFLTSIWADLEDGLVGRARIPQRCPLVTQGSAPAFAALEAAAQAAAAWEGIHRRGEGGDQQPQIGYLVGWRDVAVFAEQVAADEPFWVRARLTAAAPPLTHFEVEAASDDHLILRGSIATFVTTQHA